MATKIYKKGNVLVGEDTVSGESVRINGTFSFYSVDTPNEVITIGELTNEHKTMSAYVAEVQDESGTPVGDLAAVDTYLSINTNFKAATGGSVASVTGATIDNTDPLNPIVNALLSQSGKSSTFVGNPRKEIVTLPFAFADANYSVSVIGEDTRVWTVESKTLSGFTINSNSGAPITAPVLWIATKHG